MFMFNLLFNPNSPQGLFADPTNPPDPDPLKNSKHWLMSNRANPNFEDGTDWLDLEAGTLHIPNAQRGDMAIRIAPTVAFTAANPVAELVAALVDQRSSLLSGSRLPAHFRTDHLGKRRSICLARPDRQQA